MTDVTITQTISGGKFVYRDDRTVTVRTTDDFIGDYGDDGTRVQIDIPHGVTFHGYELDQLIENLQTIRRLIP